MAIFSWEHEVYNRWTLVLDNPFVDLLGTYQQQIPGKMNENDDTVTCLNLGYSRGLFETTPYDSIWPWGMQPI